MRQILTILSIVCFLFACKDPLPNEIAKNVTYADGITQISDDSLAFVLYAPGKQSVYIIGDFNNWTVTDNYKMKKSGDRFWLAIGNLDNSKEYICQYLVDNQIRIADPYANKISDPWNDSSISTEIYPNLIPYPQGKTSEIAMVVSTAKENYSWKVQNFTITNADNLAIYEILIRDFTEKRSIKGVEEKLPYLKSLGINAIELMPFNEFEGNDSWGYNPSFYFATDKAYGQSVDYKQFIDACHENGIAVIMDMVLNHSYGQCPLVRLYMNGERVAANNPYFNVQSPNTSYSWGYDFNHESTYTQNFVDSICAFWLKEYKIDGFRFDFTKGFTNTKGDGQAYDASRIAILKRMASQIWKRKSDAIVIFEHLADNSEERELADAGIKLWGNMNYNVNEATMGWGEEKENGKNKGDISWASYKNRGWTKSNLVAYMESHDEERLMYKNKQWGKSVDNYNVKDVDTGLKRVEAAAVIFLSIPGAKMIWQFGELGYDYKLGSSMEDGRLDKKPIRWDYADQPSRKALYNVFARMLELRNSESIFSTSNFSILLSSNFKYVILRQDNKTAIAIANFDVVQKTEPVNFEKIGTWNEIFTNTNFTNTTETENITLDAGEYKLFFND
ncbi:MAG: alpha-amylase [Paludibacter sp.]|jgi:1,4-alpha-glucan branching enzyme|nr:alpha-amylase [Paludibacter sp.]